MGSIVDGDAVDGTSLKCGCDDDIENVGDMVRPVRLCAPHSAQSSASTPASNVITPIPIKQK